MIIRIVTRLTLLLVALVAVTGIGLIAWRADRLASPARISSPVKVESNGM